MRVWYFSIVLAGVLFLVACTSVSKQNTAQHMVAATENGEVTNLAVNQILVVTLHSNPTTGFSWTITQLPDFLEQIGDEEYRQYADTTNMVGAGGTSIWNFRAVAPGSGTLRFAYQRPWEQDTPPEKTAEYKLVVRP
jgi:inhibitor of cysteine peptidase